MDSLTHALAISAGLTLIGRPDLVPFALIGAVAPDLDVLFQRFSDRDPRLYIFTHGGFTHSLAGALLTSLACAFAGLAVTGTVLPALAPASLALALSAALIGTLSHLVLDWLAYPGIPLLYPASDRKFTAGIFAGPSPFLTLASLSFLALILAGKAGPGVSLAYLCLFSLVVLLSVALKVYVKSKVPGTAIPGMVPVNWLLFEETDKSIRVSHYSLLKGPTKGVTYQKYLGPPGGALADPASPELRRFRYHSYAVVAVSDGASLRYSDPLREGGHLWYPPYFKSVTVPVKKIPGH